MIKNKTHTYIIHHNHIYNKISSDIDEEWEEDDHRLEVNEGGPPLPLLDDLPQQILAMSPPDAPPKPLQLDLEDQIVGEEEFPPTPGKIRISTMTITCHTNLGVNLSLLSVTIVL